MTALVTVDRLPASPPEGPGAAGSGTIAVVTLQRPERRNALSIALRDEMSDALDALAGDDELRVVVVTGAGAVFSAGFDLDEFGRLGEPEFAAELWASSDRWHRTVLEFPLPTVAAVNGAAYGGGFDLAVMCDLRIASPTARFAHPGALVQPGRLRAAARSRRRRRRARPCADRPRGRCRGGQSARARLACRGRRRAARRRGRGRARDRPGAPRGALQHEAEDRPPRRDRHPARRSTCDPRTPPASGWSRHGSRSSSVPGSRTSPRSGCSCPSYRSTSRSGSTAAASRSGSRSARCSSARSSAARSPGAFGDRFGRRVLLIGGASIVAVSIALYGSAESFPVLVGARLLTGVGEAAFFVGGATMVTDLAPARAPRRGDQLLVGRGVRRTRPRAAARRGHPRVASATSSVWFVAAALAGLAALLALGTRDTERDPDAAVHAKLINRAAVGPGSLLFLGLFPLAAFNSFVPLYVDDVGLTAPMRSSCSTAWLVLVVRIFGARIPDRFGGRLHGRARAGLQRRGHGDRSSRGRRRPVSSSAPWSSRPACRCSTRRSSCSRSTGSPSRSEARSSARSASSSTSRRGSARSSSAVSRRSRTRGRVRGRRLLARIVGLAAMRVIRAAARGRSRRHRPEPVGPCRRCSSPTTSRPRSAGSSRTSTSCGAGCPAAETTVLTTPYEGARTWDAAAGVPRRADPRGVAAPDAVAGPPRRRARPRGRTPTSCSSTRWSRSGSSARGSPPRRTSS